MTQGDMPHAARGKATREKLLGVSTEPRNAAQALIPELAQLSDEANWGQVWSRPGLELKIRSLCTISSLLSLERYEYAETHVRGAKRIGITRQEMVEAVVQLLFYVGLPVVHKSLAVVQKVYGEE